jgi:thioesterase domain-containing protein
LASIDSKRHMAIRPRGKRPPLFWVQAGLVQTKVLQEMERDQPVYCLYRLRPDPNERPLTCEEIAEYHIETMRSLRPEGPYALIGFCVCATIAFEMANQLRVQGETVSQLILLGPLDANVTRADLVREPALFQLGFQFRRVLFHLQKIRHYSAKEKWAYFTNSLRAIRERLTSGREARQSDDDVVSAPRTLPEHALLDVHGMDMYAVQKYFPQPYDGSAVMLRPSVGPPRAYEYPDRRWAQLIRGGLDIQMIPGDSDTMWLLPHATAMARAIEACMARIPSVLASECKSRS